MGLTSGHPTPRSFKDRGRAKLSAFIFAGSAENIAEKRQPLWLEEFLLLQERDRQEGAKIA